MQYVLIGHVVHAVLSGFANLPMPHKVQEVASVLAVPVLILPAGHAVHAAFTCPVFEL